MSERVTDRARRTIKDTVAELQTALDQAAQSPDATGRIESPIVRRSKQQAFVRFTSRHARYLYRDTAERYLAWLTAGNVGLPNDVPPRWKLEAGA